MNENSYEEYKRNFSRDQKKSSDLHRGKVLLVLGVFFSIYLFWILPFHAVNINEIRGDEVKGAGEYNPQKVYYIENLQILRAKTDTDDGAVYCVAKFLDCDQKEWIISATPGNDEDLAERIRLSSRFETELNLTVSGYFQMQNLDDLPFEADSFHSVYGKKYADAEGTNMPELNAKYLCGKYGNYTQEILLHPGVPLVSLVAGLISLLYGGFLLIKNRTRKET